MKSSSSTSSPSILGRCLLPVLNPLRSRLAAVVGSFRSGPSVRNAGNVLNVIELLEGRTFLSGSVAQGMLDPTFAAGGVAVIDVAGLKDLGHAVAIQRDGKVLVAGTTRTSDGISHALLMRLNADGSPDTSFGTGGRVILPDVATADPTTPADGAQAIPWSISVHDFASLAVQSDGKIVASGEADVSWSPGTGVFGGTAFAAVRFNRDGTRDGSFGLNGVAVADLSPTDDTVARVAVGPGGKVVVLGTVNQGVGTDQGDFGIARFNPDGRLDSSFGGDGKVTLNFTTSNIVGADRATALALTADGKVLVGGLVSNVLSDPAAPSGYAIAAGFALVRLTPDGSSDVTFGGVAGATAGAVLNTGGGSLTDVAVDADGRVLACGAAGNASGVRIMRFRADGTPDASFGNGGVAVAPGGVAGRADAVRYGLEPLVGGGVAVSAVYGTAGLVRVFNAGGGLDNSVDLAAANSGPAAVAVGPDGKLVVVGTIYPTNPSLTSGVDAPAWEAWLASADIYAARFDPGVPVTPAERADLDLLPVPVIVTPNPAPQPSPTPTPADPSGPPVTPVTPVTPPAVAASLVGKSLIRGGRSYKFNVTFSSSAAIDPSLTQGVHVSGPNGFHQLLAPAKVKRSKDGRRVIASYCATAPGGVFQADDNGTYSVTLDGPSNVTSDAPQVRAFQSDSGTVLGRFVVSVAGRSRTTRRDATAAPGVGSAAASLTVAEDVLGSKT